MKKTILIAVLMFGVAHYVFTQSKLTPTEFQVDSLFKDWTDNTKPGVALAVMNDGKLEFQKNWGLANLEHNIPVKNNTVFFFPDKADQILAFSILLLEDRKAISLNDELGKYLPNLPTHIREITINQLLNHHSGLNSLNILNEMDGGRDEDVVTKDDFDHLIKSTSSRNNKKNGEYQYVREGLKLLQLVLEEQTKMTFSEFAHKEIFEPLGMYNSKIAGHKELIKNNAQGYRSTAEGFVIANQPTNYMISDQLYTTASDILLWVDNFWRPKIGNSKIWKKMDDFVLDQGQPVPMNNRSQFIGQHRYWKYFGTDKYYHIGMTEGYAAKTVRFSEHDLAIVVLGNFGDYNGFLASACSDLYLQPFFTENVHPDRETSFTNYSAQDLQQHVGQYWDYGWESKIEVTYENDTLWLNDKVYNWTAYMKPIGKNKFFVDRRAGYTVEFEDFNSDKRLIFKIPDQSDLVLEWVSINESDVSLSELEGEYTQAELQNHCSIKINEGEVYLHIKRHEPIAFSPLSKDQFNSQNWHFNRMEIVRDSNGEVKGFNINNGLVKDLFFKKLDNYIDIN